jgi:asparagine synthase (glutamine-hydrolysing)
MCGIAGYFNLEREGPRDRSLLHDMAGALHHRGPDSSGIFQNDFAGFGFRRLSIIDLAAGDQPLFNEDRSLVLICNGEIFKYQELRAELESRGHVFSCKSDVEVLLHLYEEDGPDMVRRLNGQFAFALLDEKRRRLMLARDHAGIAPLCYTICGRQLLFASEIKALLKHPGVERKVDRTGLDQMFTLPGLVSPRTLFAGISRLRPGHYLLVDDKGVQDHEYWDLDYPLACETSPANDEGRHVEELTERFRKAVKYRLQADVPVGFYLSGGLDSSLTAAFIHSLEPQRSRHAFSISFEDRRADEARYQRMVAERVNCNLHAAHFDWNRTADMMRTMTYHAECPVKESYNTCSMELSRAARAEGIKVILTGEGADELFAGYVGYRWDRVRDQRANGVAHTPEELAEAQIRQALWGDPKLFYEHDYAAHRQARRALYSTALQDAFPEFDCLAHPLVNPDRIRGRHRVHQRSYLDFKLRMSDHLLMDHGDAMALANSVEARYPFLDIELIEYARRIPVELKLHGYTEKYILRRMGDGVLPAAIVKREKFGWFAPGSPEMLQQGVEWMHDMLSPDTIRRQGYFDPDTIASLKHRYSQSGFKVNQPFETDWLMIVATFGLFKEVFALPDLS